MEMQNGFKKVTGADPKPIKILNKKIATVMIIIPETIRDLRNKNSDLNSTVKICKEITHSTTLGCHHGKEGKGKVNKD